MGQWALSEITYHFNLHLFQYYVSSSIIAKNRHYVRESPRKFLTVLLTPAGALETAYIRRQVRKMDRK